MIVSLLSALINGVQRHVDLSTNTLQVGALKTGTNTLTDTILGNLISLQSGSEVGATLHKHDSIYTRTAALISASPGTSGSTLIGDDNSYLNFIPTGATIKGALSGIDTALANSTAVSALDGTFRIKNTANNTKQIAFDASPITTGTTRMITMADANVDLNDVNNAILKNGSRAFTANQPMGAFKFTGLGAGTTTGDSVRYEQVILTSGVNPWTGNQSLGGFIITNSGTPLNPNDLATKVYIDNLVQGLNWKETTRSATTVALPTYLYSNGSSGVGATITEVGVGALPAQDGVTLVVNDRLLVKNETAGNQPFNGIYIVTQVGTGGTPFILTRAVDANTSIKLQWATVEVSPDASTQAGAIYREADDITTIGTDNVVFSQVSQGLSYVFTSGVQLVGNIVSAHVDNLTVEVNGSQQIQQKDAGTTNVKLANMAANTVKANITGGSAAPTDAPFVSANTPSSGVFRDTNANTQVNNLITNFQTIATAGGTTTLTVGSSEVSQFTGSSAQTIVLPDATTLSQNHAFIILNRSTGSLTINKNGGTNVTTITPGNWGVFRVTNIGTAAGVWDNGNNTQYSSIYDQRTDVVASGATGNQINGPVTPGTNVTLPSAQTYNSSELQIYLNGQRLEVTNDWNTVGSIPRTQVTFVDTLQVGDAVDFIIQRNF